MKVIVATEIHLDFILQVENHPDNLGFIGNWNREEHLKAIHNKDYEHVVFEVDNRLVGYGILQDLNHPDHSISLKRYAIHEKGKGFGYQSIEAIKKYVFDTHQPNRFWLDVRGFNDRAIQLYEKAGFRKEGILKKASFMGDKYVDLHIYAILKEEFGKYT